MENILVTGGLGFIGLNLIANLTKTNKYYIHNVDNFSLGHTFFDNFLSEIQKNKVKNYKFDINEKDKISEILNDYKIKKCFHLAAESHVDRSILDPKVFFKSNVMGTLNILQTVKELDISKLIHTSTSEVYGSAKFIPITEKHPLNGQSPYSASKIAADHLANSFYLSFNTPVVTLRPFNTYGPRQSLRAIIPTIICQNLTGLKTIKLGTLKTTRDFTYISDTISAFIKAIKSKNAIGKTINIGTGYEVSIKKISEIIMKITNKKLKIISEKERTRPNKSEVNRLCCSNQLAKKVLNWKPSYTGLKGLEKGIGETIKWFGKSENLKKYKTKDFTF